VLGDIGRSDAPADVAAKVATELQSAAN